MERALECKLEKMDLSSGSNTSFVSFDKSLLLRGSITSHLMWKTMSSSQCRVQGLNEVMQMKELCER